ncbi:MAG: alpha/beta fold hydrolase [Candidatus Rokubacteria bacterium]|nr:alpha/beta fold hydrolase [Candidatus Rokubacteria bacterium]MBI2554754.1 alpha/beta fold hydrolase [Candidatus Rokubacteria bacterium]
MSTAVLNGIKLYYEVHGQGTPLVLMHGFAGTAESWKPQIPALSAKYRLILYDARGHWRSESPRSADLYSHDIFADDLRALLDHLDAEATIVGGLSMGGVIALTYYFKHPERVRALILADTGPGFRNPERRAQWTRSREVVARLLEEGGMPAFARSKYAELDYYTAPEIMLQHDPTSLAHVNRKVLVIPDSRLIDRLPEIRVPTLVLVGADDTDFLAAAEAMARKIPGAVHVVIPKAGHGANVDQPEAFNHAILDFLAPRL